jgi:hypothetical protein
MNVSRRAKKGVLILSVPLLMGLVAGCSMDDVEFNGGIFNAIGIGGNKTKAEEPKMAARAPLVLPPNMERLPEPGTPPEAVSGEVAALNDPDKMAQVSKADLERQQAAYCKVNYEDARAHGDVTGADLAVGPLGPCRGSVMSAIEKWNKGDE